jgi:hypothetical protein
MPHTPFASGSLSIPSSLLTSTDKGEPETGILSLALANGAPCSGSANTIDTLAALPDVLTNDGERQVGCRWCVLLLLIDRCVEERRLRGGTSVDELMGWWATSNSRPLGKTAEHHVRVVLYEIQTNLGLELNWSSSSRLGETQILAK